MIKVFEIVIFSFLASRFITGCSDVSDFKDVEQASCGLPRERRYGVDLIDPEETWSTATKGHEQFINDLVPTLEEFDIDDDSSSVESDEQQQHCCSCTLI